ncbi:MAG: hypothetical protein ACXW3U_17855 [Rhodoplanes sp.]
MKIPYACRRLACAAVRRNPLQDSSVPVNPLAEEIATNPNTGHPAAEAMQSDESTITYWRRQVAENCLFGVDLNSLAVELAKLALWLETIAADAPLTFLDHHFQCGDYRRGADLLAQQLTRRIRPA